MKILVFIFLMISSVSAWSMSVSELDNIFSQESETPVEIQNKVKDWFRAGCGANLSWILEVVENDQPRLCQQNDQRVIVSTRVKLSHLESDFLFSYDRSHNRLDLVFKEVSTWKLCNTPFVYEVEHQQELCNESEF